MDISLLWTSPGDVPVFLFAYPCPTCRFGHPNPIYINIVREPLDRFISYYYFLQYGDDYRVGLKRSRAGKNEVLATKSCVTLTQLKLANFRLSTSVSVDGGGTAISNKCGSKFPIVHPYSIATIISNK